MRKTVTHTLITGPRGVGKSALIRRVLEQLGRPVYGFETKKEGAVSPAASGAPLYLYPLGDCQTEKFLLGCCGERGAPPGSFDRFAPLLLGPVPENGVIVFDELGFMEAQEKQFCAAVLSRLDGDIPVIAAVKDRAVPFLERVRSHPRCRCFSVTAENRDALFQEVLRFVREQAGEDRRTL